MYYELRGILDVADDTRARKVLIAIVKSGYRPVVAGDRQTIDRLYYRPMSRRMTISEARVVYSVKSQMDQRQSRAEPPKPEEITAEEYTRQYQKNMGLLPF